MTRSTCPGCGAVPGAADVSFCGYCGARLPISATASSPRSDVAARFAQLNAHRSLPQLLRERPPAGVGFLQGLLPALFGLVFAGFAVFFLITSHRMRSGMSPTLNPPSGFNLFDVIPPLFIVIGVCISLYGVWRIVRFARSEWDVFPALVIGSRTKISRSNDSTSTTCFATLERENGDRIEARTTGNLVGGVTEGDLGVAYVRDRMLLGFRRAKM